VREHPHARKDFPASYLRKIKELPNVRLISPKVPITEVLLNTKGVITYNATTGIEALVYGKPVLSFAPNTYYPFHPAADFCSNLYELGPKLVRLVNRTVQKEDTYKYVQKLFQISNDVFMGSDTILSDEDAHTKAVKISRHLALVIDYCRNHPRGKDRSL
jgi:hypothetical protein